MYTLLIVEPREIVRLGLRAMLAESEFKIVAEAPDGETALKGTARHRPDVVLLAVVLPLGDGMSLLPRLRRDFPECNVVMYADHAWPSYLSAAISGGASGLALVEDDAPTLIARLTDAAQGRSTWTIRDRHRADGGAGGRRSQLIGRHALTHRELDILKSIAEGKTNAEIGKILKISADTVKEHLTRLFPKLGVVDRTQAAVWAAQRGLIAAEIDAGESDSNS